MPSPVPSLPVPRCPGGGEGRGGEGRSLDQSSVSIQLTYLPGLCHVIWVISQLIVISKIGKRSSLPYRHWPVDEVEVQVVQLEVLESGLASWKDVLPCMVVVPVCVRVALPFNESLGACTIQPIRF